MLKGASIVCFAHDYHSDPTSKTHLMRLLAADNRVLWVNSVGMRRPTATARDFRRLAGKLRAGLRPPVLATHNLVVANPLVLPAPGWVLADRLNAELLAAWVRRLCRRFGLSRPILWTFLPNVHRLCGRLGEELVVYHCVDEYTGFAGVAREALARMEQALVARADLVLASSALLADERRRLNPNTHLVSHGVDVAHFASALDRAAPVPAALAGLPRPVIGFFGLIAEWVDVDLVERLAVRRPDWSFVLVGRAVADVGRLRRIPNVYLPGPQPYAALPAWCRGFDVGLIPFRMNTLTVRANPLKLREYLAAGLPVVSSPLPEVSRYEGLVRTAEDTDDVLRALEASLADRSPEADRRRAAAMRAESWSHRAEEVSTLVEAALARRRIEVPA
jgi:glycosyltransferase involved in cell wall biosynthesis